MFFGKAAHFIDLSAGRFLFAVNSYLKKGRGEMVEAVKDDKSLQVDFGAPGTMCHGDVL